MQITFRKSYDKRVQTGELIGTLPNGNLKVRITTRAARGGSWVATTAVVKPSEVRA